MGDFLMPSLGADMESGTVLEWRVGVGDPVHRGDIIAVIDTDKSDIEVEVFEDGIVDALLVEVGADVAVGTPLAHIREAAAPAPATPQPAATTSRPPEASRPPEEPPAARPSHRRTRHRPAPTTPVSAVRASPLAKRRAQELGVDLATVAGTGPGGAIRVDDVVAPTPDRRRVAAGSTDAMRRAIGDLMARAKREIPHYYLASTVDLHHAIDWLTTRNAARPVTARLLPAAVLLTATARAAARCPSMNGRWDDGFEPASAVHLGVAVSLRGGGLVAPAIHDADQLTVDQMMTALTDLVDRARHGRLRSSEVADGTITVTNLGERGADEVHGVIYPPQVALVGFGRIVERPWACDGLVGARPTVRISLAADHRASDGHDGSRLLGTIEDLLQDPEALA